MHTHTHTTHSRAHKDSRHMPAVPSPPSVMAAGARDTSSDNQQSSKLTTAPARETLASMKNKEAAFYGMDSEEFTDRVTSIMTDYVEGAMQDVKRDFCRAMAAGRGGVRGKHGGDGKEAGAVYESHVAPRVQQLIDRFSKRVDRRADAFEIYLARNIFKVPEGTRESAGQVCVSNQREGYRMTIEALEGGG
ncbi:hypothetical protein Naga_101321g1 [Nannochloropsis gaditana]|uniref:Uncharacterized protein n=1 Tax=Nannochloropsis gaditana TaxID=72520 RepID=W7TIW2_9STRA|nr:hypothetical protein Naga_101321g1 [Nannochloropsis gaditana]